MINQRSVSYSRSVSISTGKAELSENEKYQILSLKRKFWWFSTVASINHALNYVVTSFATSLLSPHLGGVILGLSWTLNAVSGLTVATAVVRRFGFKYAMIISLWGYAGQIASLYFAIIAPASAWTIAIIGSVVAGFTSAIWWTAQGVYFEQSCIEIEKIMPQERFKADPGEVSTIDTIRAELSAHWTIIYQVSDIVVFLALSAIPLAGGVNINFVILGLVFVGIITALLGFTFDPLGTTTGEMTFEELKEAVVAVPVQMKNDARVVLLSPFVFGFGISTAMFAYYVNSSIISDSSGLGTLTLGFLEAFSYFVAVVSAYPYAWVSSSFKQGQDWVIQFGSLSFLLSGAVVLGLSKGALGTWQNILIAKGLYGLGRGVFEGSCRAVYAAMFTGKELSTAFSSQTLSAGFSGGICFFLFNILSKDSISAITVGNGVLALGTYSVLMFLVNNRVPLSWGNLFTVCCSRSGLQHDVEPNPERAVNKYSKTSSKSGLKTSLLDDRHSEQDIFTVNNVIHHKMQVTPTNSMDDSR